MMAAEGGGITARSMPMGFRRRDLSWRQGFSSPESGDDLVVTGG